MARVNRVILIVGTRGTGKTDFTKSLVHGHKKKVLVVDTFDNPPWRNFKTWDHPEWEAESIPVIPMYSLKDWHGKTGRVFGADTSRIMKLITTGIYNSLIVFEDATKYIGSRLSDDVRMFVLDSKQKNLDLVFIFHSLMDVPRDLTRVSDYLVLFKTNELLDTTIKSKYPNQQIWRAFEKVNKHKDRYFNKTVAIGG